VKATETKVEDFLAQSKAQFIIPVYQRNYDWTIAQCKQFLQDILEVGSSDKLYAHFIGSIVYVHDNVYVSSKLKELVVIDGQQRLTTLTLIYLAVRSVAQNLGDKRLVDEIDETYLTNKFASEAEKLKLRPTENNNTAIQYLLREDGSEEFVGYSRIIENFNFFKGKIKQENYQYVLDGLSKLIFVEISLDRERDDPQRIFESLNSTGLDLSEADLIRNYILIGLSRKDQDRIYRNYWEIIEKLARDETSNKNRVSDFIRDYLTVEIKRIPNKKKVYQEFKAMYPTTSADDLENNLRDIKTIANYYNKLINPDKESDKDIRLQVGYINKLEIEVAFPFLLRVYHDYNKSVIDKEIFVGILNLIQSYAWRRFIMGIGTEGRNKIFMNLYDKVDKNNYLQSVQYALLQKPGTQRFPRDAEVIDALRVKDLYNINSKNRTYLFEKLENFENRERVLIESNSGITVEHIFPQNPSLKWERELGAKEYEHIKENHLNTIGNLTLSGNNGKLGNKTFLEKRDLPEAGYKDSRLWLNKHLATLGKWDSSEIEQRFNIIAERFLKIWQYPELNVGDLENDEINIFQAEDPTHKRLDYAVFLNQKIEVNQASQLYIEIIGQLFELQKETFFTTDLSDRLGLTRNPSKVGLRRPFPINDVYFIETNIDSVGKFERIKYALTLLGLEDELSIKYSKK
jgi:uncharacterized protein with ParB-like and HNH nuclease domain